MSITQEFLAGSKLLDQVHRPAYRALRQHCDGCETCAAIGEILRRPPAGESPAQLRRRHDDMHSVACPAGKPLVLAWLAACRQLVAHWCGMEVR